MRGAAPPRELRLRARGLSFPALAAGEGPPVLLLHGFPDTPETFRPLLGSLGAAGYRAVAPCLRGYHRACLPPPKACDAIEASADAVALAGAIAREPVHLVGHDWGAVAAYLAAARAPARFATVTTLAIPHPRRLLRAALRCPGQLRRSAYIAFFQLPFLPERALAAGLVERLWRGWSPGFTPPPAILAAATRALSDQDVARRALAYYRALRRPLSRRLRRALSDLRRPLSPPFLCVTGARDGCLDTRLHDLACRPEDFAGGLEVARIPDAGHFVHLERPRAVHDLLLSHWRAVSGRRAGDARRAGRR